MKAFDKSIRQEAPAEREGARAALTVGKRGRGDRKAARLHDDSIGGRARSAGGSSPFSGRFGQRIARYPVRALAIAACLVFSCLFIYPMAKDCYDAARTRDQLQAQYAALQERNSAIQKEIDALSTDQGVEDKARSDLGWTKEGENAVNVTGLGTSADPSSDAASGTIAGGSVAAPQTWYSPVLDIIFDYHS